jgi:hypothetical protein
MKVDISEAEWSLIQEARAKQAAKRQAEDFRLAVAETAAGFFRYLDKAGMEPSFQEFVGGFGYQDEAATLVYEYVLQLRKVLWK